MNIAVVFPVSQAHIILNSLAPVPFLFVLKRTFRLKKQLTSISVY